MYDDNPDVYTWSGTWPWFHGYRGETTVLFDDFRGTIPFNQLLRLLDRYPCTVETKGGFMKWRATKIYVTSALKPEDCYDKEKFHADDHIKATAKALRRNVSAHNTSLPKEWDQCLYGPLHVDFEPRSGCHGSGPLLQLLTLLADALHLPPRGRRGPVSGDFLLPRFR